MQIMMKKEDKISSKWGECEKLEGGETYESRPRLTSDSQDRRQTATRSKANWIHSEHALVVRIEVSFLLHSQESFFMVGKR